MTTRFLFIMGALTAFFSAFVLYRTYAVNRKALETLVNQQADLALEFDLAIRGYVGDQIRPAMEQAVGPNEFVPEAMSTSYVARNVFEKVRQKFPEYIIKFSSDNPRNPANQAGPEELKMIAYFNANPSVDRWTGPIDLNGKQYLAHFAARRMKDDCLRCHGEPEKAPASLLTRYGSTAGFHRPVGQVIALDTVAIPLDSVHAALGREVTRQSGVLAIGVLVLFGAGTLLFRVLVSRRLGRLAGHFRQIAQQPESAHIRPIDVSAGDEIGDLEAGFNTLVERLHDAHASLEHRVDERTAELARANRELQHRIELDNLITTISTRFINLPHDQIDTGVNNALKTLGEFAGDDRSYVFHFNDDLTTMGCTHEWCAEGIIPAIEEIRRISCDQLPWFMESMRRWEVFHVPRVADLPPEARAEKDHFTAQMIQSLVCVPMTMQNKLVGFLGFDSVRREKIWPEDIIALLRLVGVILARALAHQQVQRDLFLHQQQLERAIDAAESANRAKSLFLANVSHEIRTPMTAIMGFADLVGENTEHCSRCPNHAACEVRAENRKYVQTIQSNGDHLLRIINDILDLSKIEAGKLDVEHSDCCLERLIAEISSIAGAQCRDKGIAWSVEHAGDTPEYIRTDPTRLRQILLNLIGNAIKFTSRGSVKLIIRMGMGGQDTSVAGLPRIEFDIIDTGIGISPEQARSLFQPFQQADASATRQFGGTGLGLALSKKLAEQLGGTITLDSRPGQGTTFHVTIAALISHPDREPASRPSIGPDSPAVTEHLPQLNLNCRILVVEDAPDNQVLLTAMLRRVGAQVTVAGNGREALDLLLPLAREPGTAGGILFDVILMDMQMPVMDGYETTRRIRQAGLNVPVVALTAHAMDGDRAKCIEAGCNAFATKPIVRKDLLSAILTTLAAANTSPEVKEQASATDPAHRFLAGLPPQADAIQRALDQRDLPSLASLACELQPVAAELGFESIDRAAGTLKDLAETQEELAAITVAVRELVETCRRTCETRAE